MKASHSFPDIWEDRGLNPTEEVFEQDEEEFSSLLDASGNPIKYKSKKLGFIGFVKLKEDD